MTKVASFNVNSITKRLPTVLDWLQQHSPDVLILQELKCTADKFPTQAITDAGYHVSVVGQKAYNGVAILSQKPHILRRDSLPLPQDAAPDDQARYIEIDYTDHHDTRLIVAGIYLPNGNPVQDDTGNLHAKFTYKIDWMQRLYEHAQSLLRLEIPVIIAGDFNIIPHDIDCYDPAAWKTDALFHHLSRQQYFRLCHCGFQDAWRVLHSLTQQYSFWDYQAGRWQKGDGIRIDHLLLSPQAAEYLEAAGIDAEPRGGSSPSDHTPVWCTLNTGI